MMRNNWITTPGGTSMPLSLFLSDLSPAMAGAKRTTTSNEMTRARANVDRRGEWLYLCTCTGKGGDGPVCTRCGYWIHKPPMTELYRRNQNGEPTYQPRDDERWWEGLLVSPMPGFMVKCRDCGVLAESVPSQAEANEIVRDHVCAAPPESEPSEEK